MKQEDFEASIRQHQAIKKQALDATLFRNALKVSDPKARFPGFKQRKVNYEARHVISSEARPIETDITLHESVSMVLKDGTKLYSDIFVPSNIQDLSLPQLDHSTIPALIAW